MKGNRSVVSQNQSGYIKHKNYQLKKKIIMSHSEKRLMMIPSVSCFIAFCHDLWIYFSLMTKWWVWHFKADPSMTEIAVELIARWFPVVSTYIKKREVKIFLFSICINFPQASKKSYNLSGFKQQKWIPWDSEG